MNRLKIFKDKEGFSKLELNGVPLEQVLDFSYNKTSAHDSTEVVIKLHVDELGEINIK